MPSIFGILAREARVSCSALWPARKVDAGRVRISRIERLAWVERVERIWILMVATEPEAQRRWWVFIDVGVVGGFERALGGGGSRRAGRRMVRGEDRVHGRPF
jgi:hypothetical protein